MARKDKIKLPKRLAGIKISKNVRKGPVGQFLRSQSGQALVAEALVLAGGALLARKAADPDTEAGQAVRHPGKTTKKARRKTADAVHDASEALTDVTSRLSYAFAAATRTFRESLEGAAPQWPDIAEAPPADAAPPAAGRRASKKNAARPPEPPVPH